MAKKVVTLYWSRAPGKFVNKLTGQEALTSKSIGPGPFFQGTVREWYETLVETIVDAGTQAGVITGNLVTSRDVATILEHLVSYRPNIEEMNAVYCASCQKKLEHETKHIGTLNNRFKVFISPVKSNQIFVSGPEEDSDYAEVNVLDMCII